MRNLLLFHPAILEDAVRVRATSEFGEDTPLENLRDGERHTRIRLSTTSSWVQTLDFQLPSATTQTADFVAGAVWDSLRSTVGSFSFRGASASYFCGADISSITAWYDAAYQYDLTPGGNIINWYDRSSNGRTMTQASDVNRLSLIPSAVGVNGFPISLSTASQMQAVASFILSDAFNAGRFTIWAIIKTGSDVSTFQKIFRGTGFHLTLAVESNLVKLTVHDSGGAKVVTRSISSEETYLVRARHDGTSIKLSVNGGTEGSTTCGNVADMSGTVTIGETSNPFLGYIGEIILSNQDVGSAQTPIDYYLMAKWVSAAPLITHTVSSNTLYGPRLNDYYTTFSETGGFQYWWVTYVPSGLTDLYQSKVFAGLAFDMGVEADYEISRSTNNSDYTFDSGARRLERVKRPLYTISLTWTGVTDAKVTSFQDIIAQYSDSKTFILATTDQHQILDNKRLIHCRLVDAQCQKVGGIDDWNIVTAEFEELLG